MVVSGITPFFTDGKMIQNCTTPRQTKRINPRCAYTIRGIVSLECWVDFIKIKNGSIDSIVIQIGSKNLRSEMANN